MAKCVSCKSKATHHCNKCAINFCLTHAREHAAEAGEYHHSLNMKTGRDWRCSTCGHQARSHYDNGCSVCRRIAEAGGNPPAPPLHNYVTEPRGRMYRRAMRTPREIAEGL